MQTKIVLLIALILAGIGCGLVGDPDPCDRSKTMRDALEDVTDRFCNLITEEDLAAIEYLSFAGDTSTLSRSDLRGVEHSTFILSLDDLESLQPKARRHLTDVRLVGGNRYELPAALLSEMDRLEKLDLAYFSFAGIHPEAFAGADSLHDLRFGFADSRRRWSYQCVGSFNPEWLRDEIIDDLPNLRTIRFCAFEPSLYVTVDTVARLGNRGVELLVTNSKLGEEYVPYSFAYAPALGTPTPTPSPTPTVVQPTNTPTPKPSLTPTPDPTEIARKYFRADLATRVSYTPTPAPPTPIPAPTINPCAQDENKCEGNSWEQRWRNHHIAKRQATGEECRQIGNYLNTCDPTSKEQANEYNRRNPTQYLPPGQSKYGGWCGFGIKQITYYDGHVTSECITLRTKEERDSVKPCTETNNIAPCTAPDPRRIQTPTPLPYKVSYKTYYYSSPNRSIFDVPLCFEEHTHYDDGKTYTQDVTYRTKYKDRRGRSKGLTLTFILNNRGTLEEYIQMYEISSPGTFDDALYEAFTQALQDIKSGKVTPNHKNMCR